MNPFINVLVIILTSCTHALHVQTRQINAPNATQAMAVDNDHIYTISNSKIVKRDKETGDSISEWQGPLQHLNSGIVLDGKLLRQLELPKVADDKFTRNL